MQFIASLVLVLTACSCSGGHLIYKNSTLQSTGNLVVPRPTEGLHAAPKVYVDEKISASRADLLNTIQTLRNDLNQLQSTVQSFLNNLNISYVWHSAFFTIPGQFEWTLPEGADTIVFVTLQAGGSTNSAGQTYINFEVSADRTNEVSVGGTAEPSRFGTRTVPGDENSATGECKHDCPHAVDLTMLLNVDPRLLGTSGCKVSETAKNGAGCMLQPATTATDPTSVGGSSPWAPGVPSGPAFFGAGSHDKPGSGFVLVRYQVPHLTLKKP